MYKISGENIYLFGNKKIRLMQGEILFIPQGERFETWCVGEKQGRYIIVDFEADIAEAEAQKYRLDRHSDAAFLFDGMAKAFLFQTAENRYKAISLFYKLLSYLCRETDQDYPGRHKRDLIAPAIHYLKDHIYDCGLKTECLHELCAISDAYFRKVFIACFGISPKQYITNRRLALAKNLLDSGDYTYIYEVAEAAGYSDALYFSKLFKKHYGYAPSDRLREEK